MRQQWEWLAEEQDNSGLDGLCNGWSLPDFNWATYKAQAESGSMWVAVIGDIDSADGYCLEYCNTYADAVALCMWETGDPRDGHNVMICEVAK